MAIWPFGVRKYQVFFGLKDAISLVLSTKEACTILSQTTWKVQTLSTNWPTQTAHERQSTPKVDGPVGLNLWRWWVPGCRSPSLIEWRDEKGLNEMMSCSQSSRDATSAVRIRNWCSFEIAAWWCIPSSSFKMFELRWPLKLYLCVSCNVYTPVAFACFCWINRNPTDMYRQQTAPSFVVDLHVKTRWTAEQGQGLMRCIAFDRFDSTNYQWSRAG